MARYGLDDQQWQIACDEIRNQCIAVARKRDTITYGELASRLRTIKVHPGAYVLHALLRAVCATEFTAGRGMLCAVVVSQRHGRPGAGFYRMLATMDYYCEDPVNCWQQIVGELYDYWREHGRE